MSAIFTFAVPDYIATSLDYSWVWRRFKFLDLRPPEVFRRQSDGIRETRAFERQVADLRRGRMSGLLRRQSLLIAQSPPVGSKPRHATLTCPGLRNLLFQQRDGGPLHLGAEMVADEFQRHDCAPKWWCHQR